MQVNQRHELDDDAIAAAIERVRMMKKYAPADEAGIVAKALGVPVAQVRRVMKGMQ